VRVLVILLANFKFTLGADPARQVICFFSDVSHDFLVLCKCRGRERLVEVRRVDLVNLGHLDVHLLNYILFDQTLPLAPWNTYSI